MIDEDIIPYLQSGLYTPGKKTSPCRSTGSLVIRIQRETLLLKRNESREPEPSGQEKKAEPVEPTPPYPR